MSNESRRRTNVIKGRHEEPDSAECVAACMDLYGKCIQNNNGRHLRVEHSITNYPPHKHEFGLHVAPATKDDDV